MSHWVVVRQQGNRLPMLLNTDSGLAIYPHPKESGKCIMSQTGSSFAESFNPGFLMEIEDLILDLGARDLRYDARNVPYESNE